MQKNDFDWMKNRLDDLANKWQSDKERDEKYLRMARDALEAILKVEKDDKNNHYEVMRGIASDALEKFDW